MVVVECSVPSCDFKSEDVSEALAIALLTNHGLAHSTVTQGPSPPSGPRLERPKVDVGISTEEWNVFTRRWEVFRTDSQIDAASAPSQLFQCAEKELGDSILKADPNATNGTLETLLTSMKALAVIPTATGVLRSELLQMRQEREESFRAYAARVRGKAETCAFVTRCSCGLDVNYTDNSIRDTLLNGINDQDIRREVLGTRNILDMTVNNVIALVENKEIARNALPSSVLSAMSSFKRQATAPGSPGSDLPNVIERSRKSNCLLCKKIFNVYNEGPKGWNTKPHKYCTTCFRDLRRQKRLQHQDKQSVSSIQAGEADVNNGCRRKDVRCSSGMKQQ